MMHSTIVMIKRAAKLLHFKELYTNKSIFKQHVFWGPWNLNSAVSPWELHRIPWEHPEILRHIPKGCQSNIHPVLPRNIKFHKVMSISFDLCPDNEYNLLSWAGWLCTFWKCVEADPLRFTRWLRSKRQDQSAALPWISCRNCQIPQWQ